MAINTAKGTVLRMANQDSPLTYTTIGQVQSISGPGRAEPVAVQTNSHDPSSLWRRRIAVLLNPGQISFDVNFQPDDISVVAGVDPASGESETGIQVRLQPGGREISAMWIDEAEEIEAAAAESEARARTPEPERPKRLYKL